jgi:hypothetical protein
MFSQYLRIKAEEDFVSSVKPPSSQLTYEVVSSVFMRTLLVPEYSEVLKL